MVKLKNIMTSIIIEMIFFFYKIVDASKVKFIILYLYMIFFLLYKWSQLKLLLSLALDFFL